MISLCLSLSLSLTSPRSSSSNPLSFLPNLKPTLLTIYHHHHHRNKNLKQAIIIITYNQSPISSFPFFFFNIPYLLKYETLTFSYFLYLLQRSARNLTCRAELSQDVPFAFAIGSCILNSLVFPVPSSPHDDDDGNSLIDSTDARLAVMGIISFIPYFNWLVIFFEFYF